MLPRRAPRTSAPANPPYTMLGFGDAEGGRCCLSPSKLSDESVFSVLGILNTQRPSAVRVQKAPRCPPPESRAKRPSSTSEPLNRLRPLQAKTSTCGRTAGDVPAQSVQGLLGNSGLEASVLGPRNLCLTTPRPALDKTCLDQVRRRRILRAGTRGVCWWSPERAVTLSSSWVTP